MAKGEFNEFFRGLSQKLITFHKIILNLAELKREIITFIDKSYLFPFSVRNRIRCSQDVKDILTTESIEYGNAVKLPTSA